VVSKALKLINHDLASIDDPRVLPLRRRLVDEWSQLRAMPQPDFDGAVLEVSSLVDAIDHLPLKGWVPSDDAPMSDDQIDQNGHKSWFHQVLSDVRGLIKIRRIDETRLPALSNEGQFVIRETLRLRLTLLQIALVNRDPAGIARDLSVAKAWVESYFEATDPSVMQFAARLDALSGLELAPNPIDLSEVLTIVRQMRHTVRDDP
jgi:uroporphyrin-3 C-methyltransferase